MLHIFSLYQLLLVVMATYDQISNTKQCMYRNNNNSHVTLPIKATEYSKTKVTIAPADALVVYEASTWLGMVLTLQDCHDLIEFSSSFEKNINKLCKSWYQSWGMIQHKNAYLQFLKMIWRTN